MDNNPYVRVRRLFIAVLALSVAALGMLGRSTVRRAYRKTAQPTG